jgi:3-carboxy-cis,cis-muconate cycloisomerase
MKLLDSLFRWEALAEIFSDSACLQSMLEFEAALARAEAAAGIVPAAAASAMTAKCRAEFFDQQKIAEAAALSGNLAIPLIKQLKELVAESDKTAAGLVHWGATSQDAIDTGLILQLRKALELISQETDRLCATLASLTDRYRTTPIVGRTWLQHAVPTTLGAKFAGWLDALMRHRERMRETQTRCLVLQFGGAVGTLVALGSAGPSVAKHLGAELKLSVPSIPWHSHRDRVAEIATTLGLLVGTLGKIAQDLALHMQTEIAEFHEPREMGRGGSSAMPHKQNPVTVAAILAAAVRVPGLVSTMLAAMQQQDERGLGNWHAEWETLPELVCLSGGALHHLAELLPKLEIDTNRMRQNLDLTGGLIFSEGVAAARGEKIGRSEARAILDAATQTALKTKQPLRAVLENDPAIKQHFSPQEFDKLFDPTNYAGASGEFIDGVLAQYKTQKGSK